MRSIRFVPILALALVVAGCGGKSHVHPTDNSPLGSFVTKSVEVDSATGTLSGETDMTIDCGTGADAGKVRFFSKSLGTFVVGKNFEQWESATGADYKIKFVSTWGPDSTTLIFSSGSGSASWDLHDTPFGPG